MGEEKMDGRGKKRRSFRNLCGIQKGRFKGWDLVGLAKILASGYRISAVGRIEQTLSTSLLWIGEEKMDGRGKKRRSFRNLCGSQKGLFEG